MNYMPPMIPADLIDAHMAEQLGGRELLRATMIVDERGRGIGISVIEPICRMGQHATQLVSLEATGLMLLGLAGESTSRWDRWRLLRAEKRVMRVARSVARRFHRDGCQSCGEHH